MFTITGNKKTYTQSIPISIFEFLKQINLSDHIIAVKINDAFCDMSFIITADTELQLIGKTDESLEIIRHSAAHLLAQAISSIYPKTKFAIGPVIENGFYYDIDCEHVFSEDELPALEATMQEYVNAKLEVTRHVFSKPDAIKHFADDKQTYKVELINSFSDETVTVYKQGEFSDLCRGPHVANTGQLSHFKLMKISGAYWRSDAKNKMLQRIYGTAWHTKKELDNYLHMLEEAKKRDHRIIGKAMNLFHIQDEAQGMVFWHANGWKIWQEIEQYIRTMYHTYGYQEIKTPQIVAVELWKASGHWDKFHDDMMDLVLDEKQYVIKPMNCPCHVQVYKQGIVSYRDLPIRLAEFGSCHRYESSGSLHGIMRIRNFTQDDGHIFCTEEQITQEVSVFVDMLFEVYKKFGLADISVKLSTRPTERIGSDDVWDKAESALATVLDIKKLNWKILKGDGAFYGPKVEFVVKDCIGRSWTTGTIQLDFMMPERLGACYIGKDGSKNTPVMLHRAICGSLERFIGILLEHYAGNLPLWIAPVQCAVLNVSEKQIEYCQSIYAELNKHNIRVVIDTDNDKIAYKIRKHSMAKVPYCLLLGDKEVADNNITIRQLDGRNKTISLNETVEFFT